MVLNEMDWLVIWGWPKEKTYLPAVNNLSVRKRELQDELIAGIGQIQKETKAKLARLEEQFRHRNARVKKRAWHPPQDGKSDDLAGTAM